MHEFGIIQGVMETALQRAAEVEAEQIHVIRLKVGRLSGVIPEAMHFAYDVACEGTLAEGSKLIIDEVPARCECQKCGRIFEPDRIVYKCPDCGEISRNILNGRELELVDMEVS